VLPARNARHGHLYTHSGCINLNNEKYARDFTPVEEGCGCPTCQRYTRAYLRHLLRSGEVLGLRLCVMHNLWFYNKLAADIRSALDVGEFEAFRSRWSGVFEKRI